MINKFIDNIIDYNLIEKNDRITIGYSGGIDSSVLLYLLKYIQINFDIELFLAHFNHGVRGKEADRDQEFSRNMAKNYGILYFTEKSNMNDFAKKNKMSKEAAGRLLRKNFFRKTMEKTKSNKLALAHNYNDQVETILFRILRGTGVDGLRGMNFRDGYIIRPLLNFKRVELESFIKEKKIDYVEDSTNSESIYQRNKIRNLLIPYLKEEFNPNLEENIFNLGQLARADGELLEGISKKAFNESIAVFENRMELDINALKEYHLAVQGRTIRLVFLYLLNSTDNISFKNIEDILNLMKLESGKFIDNIQGIVIRKSYSKLIFQKDDYQKKDLYYILKMGNNNFSNKSIYLEETNLKACQKNQVTIPIEIVNNKLIVRNRKNGDKISPLGLNGSKKLKDIFIDKKIDRKRRDDFLLICDDQNIFWIVDLMKSQLTDLKSKEDKYIKITIEDGEE